MKKNLKELPITEKNMENRQSFSRYVYDLHELINRMLHKKSTLSYEEVRERYEHFRSRCIDSSSLKKRKKTIKKSNKHVKEKGCTKSLYGLKPKCIIKIVPDNKKIDAYSIDEKCLRKAMDPTTHKKN
jgi:hypothetical protein